MTMTMDPPRLRRPASRQVIDFALINDQTAPRPLRPDRTLTGRMKKTSPKQLRARARRNTDKAGEALAKLHKPIEEWDDEELARGRPRASDGSFSGRAPQWISRAVHEGAVDRFRQIVRDDMNAKTVHALRVLTDLLNSDEYDDKGKPLVPASTKAEIAKWLVEQVLGKPTQRTETDISVKLQAVLASATVMPGSTTLPALTGSYAQASPRTEQDLHMFQDVEDAEWSEED